MVAVGAEPEIEIGEGLLVNFVAGMASVFLAGRLEDTVVAAPRFAGTGSQSCDDKLAPGEIGDAGPLDLWS